LVFDLALPHHKELPAGLRQEFLVPRITLDGFVKLAVPELFVRRWSRGTGTARMTMPETAVDEYDLAQPREHYVGAPGEVAAIETEPVSHSMERASHKLLGASIPSFDVRHDLPAFFGRESVGHSYEGGSTEIRPACASS